MFSFFGGLGCSRTQFCFAFFPSVAVVPHPVPPASRAPSRLLELELELESAGQRGRGTALLSAHPRGPN